MKLARLSPGAVATEVALIFSRPGFQALAKPDVFGTVELAPTGAYGSKLGRKLTIASASKPVRELRPNFGESVCFRQTSWHPEMRLRVDLTDKDLINNDKIATVEVRAQDVSAAYAFGKAMHVHVGDQDTTQLRFVVLNVTKSPDETE